MNWVGEFEGVKFEGLKRGRIVGLRRERMEAFKLGGFRQRCKKLHQQHLARAQNSSALAHSCSCKLADL